MNLYVIYDNLYEEYQYPFCMKNDNIAKIEFEQFVSNAIEKAPEKEKAKTASRFLLCKFNEIKYDREKAEIVIEAMGMEPPFTSKAEPIEWNNKE